MGLQRGQALYSYRFAGSGAFTSRNTCQNRHHPISRACQLMERIWHIRILKQPVQQQRVAAPVSAIAEWNHNFLRVLSAWGRSEERRVGKEWRCGRVRREREEK